MRRIALAAIVAAFMAVGADAALAHSGHSGRLPDAEIFATNNTRVITDPADPQLRDPLFGFERKVERIIERGGGKARSSQLLDGVFFSSDLKATTFERSREFDVDRVTPGELHDIADRVRQRFDQESVLTFDFPERPSDPVDAVQIEVPGVSAQQLRDGLLADRAAAERLFGGSVTLDGRLVLIASFADVGREELHRRDRRRPRRGHDPHGRRGVRGLMPQSATPSPQPPSMMISWPVM